MKFLLCLLLFLVSTVLYAEDYSIILLSEDNGTSLHIFKEEIDSQSLPDIREIFTEYTSVKLSLFEDYPESGALALKKILDHASAQIQTLKVNHPISIKMLSYGEIQFIKKEKLRMIHAEIQKYISSHYPNTLILKNSEIISGKMKALYGWLTINYLKKNLQNETPTTGSIFLNNYALDIAFAISKSEKPLDEITFTIHDKKYIVFAKSFLELGLANVHSTLLSDEYAKFCFPKDAEINNNESGDFLRINCSEIFQGLFKNANLSQKVLHTFRVPQFIAFGDFYPTYHFFGVEHNFDRESFEQDVLLPQCHNVWDTLKNAYPAEPTSLLLYYCSHGIYFSDLFFDALQLRSEQINVLAKIDDVNIDWVLGAVLYSSISSIPANKSTFGAN